MTQLSFKGSGTTDLDNQVGIGQGLQVGITKIDFGVGKIQLSTSANQNKTVGKIKTFKNLGASENTVRSFIFKAATKCTIQYQNTFIEYNLLNEWFTLNGIETELVEIVRSSSGITPDIFDYTFLASDKPNFSISVEKGTRNSNSEILFESASRTTTSGEGGTANHYKNFNIQGARNITLIGKATSGTGTVGLSLEIFDPASASWVELVPKLDIFTLANGDTKTAQIGKDIAKKIKQGDGHGAVAIDVAANIQYLKEGEAWTPTAANPSGIGGLVRSAGYDLPSGDSILRVKAVVLTNPITFSLGVIEGFV